MGNLRILYEKFGVSPWLDNLSRDMILDGSLAKLIDDGIRGITSNPSIFEKSFQQSTSYKQPIANLLESGRSNEETYWQLAIEDIQQACDLLLDVYTQSGNNDGFVSLEVSPAHANNHEATVNQAHQLWQKVNRPNLMIKVPATKACLPAISELISQNINVNVTLIFSLSRYLQVINAYMNGLEKCQDPSTVRSVASFFISRVDSMIDPLLNDHPELKGKTALAQAQAAYGIYLESFNQLGMRWLSLKSRGAVEQKPLWASTSTKDPNFPQLMYVDNLLAPSSVNTMPNVTIDELIKSGISGEPVDPNKIEEAHEILAKLTTAGINLVEITDKLESEGIQKFQDAFSSMLQSIKTI